MNQLGRYFAEAWEYFKHLGAVWLDQARLSGRDLVVRLAGVAIIILAAAGLVIAAGWFVLAGLAGGLARLTGSAWGGDLLAGLFVLAVVSLGLTLLIHWRKQRSLSRLKEKYGARQHQQRARFGSDVPSGDHVAHPEK